MSDIHFKKIPATFHHIPRTGGTSFEKWVVDNITDYELMPFPSLTQANKHMIPNYDYVKNIWPTMGTRFSFVRNPFSRIVSSYHYVGQLCTDRATKYEQALRDKNTENWRTHPFQNKNIVSSLLDDRQVIELYQKGFDYYLYCLLENPNEWYRIARPASHHLIFSFWEIPSQYQWLCGHMPDIVVRLESLDEDFKKIQELLKSNVNLPHINTTDHSDYQSYYTEKTRQQVADKFKDDLAFFKYEF